MKGRKRRNKKYSPEFKISVIIDMREHHLSYGETMRKYFPHLAPRGIGFLKQWERIYLEEGKVGFYIEKRGRATKMDNPRKGRPRKKPLNKQEENDLITSRFFAAIINKLYSNRSLKSIAKEYNVSSNTVFRMLKLLSPAPTPASLPETLSIDEFKGNTDGEKYNCILTDPKNHKIVDILPNRKKTNLIDYFKQYKNRENVKFFIMDMTGNYRDIVRVFTSFSPTLKYEGDKLDNAVSSSVVSSKQV